MNELTHRLLLDMRLLTSQATVRIKKYDTKNKLVILLTEHGKLYNISARTSAAFIGKRADGTIVVDECNVIGNTIEYTLTAQASAEAGIVACEIRLYDANKNLLTSPRFTVVVDEVILSDEDEDKIVSGGDFNAPIYTLTEAKELIEDIEKRLENGEFNGADGESAYEIWLAVGNVGTKEDFLASLKDETGKSAYEYAQAGGYKGTEEEFAEVLATSDMRLDTLEGKLADLLYEAIAITAFTNNVNTAEMGAVINTVAIAWTLNKTPETLTLDGEALDIESEGTSLSGLGLTADKTWTLAATDEREATASRSTSIKFVNGVYYGVLTEGSAINSATILALTRKLQSNKTTTFTVTAGSTQKIAFALPARYGTPVFSVGGFEGGFELAATFDFKNGSGYTESYNVWLSSKTGLGNTTVSVK